MGTLILMRHGQSQWNLENRFTGWTDVPLTEQGKSDAAKAANVIADFTFDIAFTSRLVRAADTLSIVLKTLKQTAVPIIEDSALNERHYGDLQGFNKAETVEKYGTEQVQLWRRSYETRPPNGESIEDCVRRVTPFFLQYIMSHIATDKTVLIAAHGNSMRPIRKYLDHLGPDETAELENGLCIPYIYYFKGENMTRKEERAVPGIVTKGASLTEKKVEKGTV